MARRKRTTPPPALKQPKPPLDLLAEPPQTLSSPPSETTDEPKASPAASPPAPAVEPVGKSRIEQACEALGVTLQDVRRFEDGSDWVIQTWAGPELRMQAPSRA